MIEAKRAVAIQPFYLRVEPGTRFCLFHPRWTGVEARGGIVYVHPFAEEMNKARRMVALQARRMAEAGYAVLQVDLFGCGDSSGELRDARVAKWQRDITAAANWMQEQGYSPLSLWGLRFGALLAVDWVRAVDRHVDRLLLWQPVTSGERHLTQFLRLAVAADMLASSNTGGVAALRKRLAAGESVEVGGYEISSSLASDMDAMRIDRMAVSDLDVDWFEVHAQGEALGPATSRFIEQWCASGAAVRTHVISGDPFWATAEIAQCSSLLDRTMQSLRSECAFLTTSAQ